MIIRIFILMLAMILTGCHLSTTRSQIAEDVHIDLIPDSQKSCECTTASQYRVTNRGGSGSFNLQTQTRSPSDPAGTAIISPSTQVPIGSQSNYDLACTVQPDSQQRCLQSVISVVDGTAYGGTLDLQSASVIESFAKATLQNMTAMGGAPDGCTSACRGNGSANCTLIKPDSPDSVGGAIALLLGQSHRNNCKQHYCGPDRE